MLLHDLLGSHLHGELLLLSLNLSLNLGLSCKLLPHLLLLASLTHLLFPSLLSQFLHLFLLVLFLLSLECFETGLLLEHTNELLSGDVLALLALPFLVWHLLEVSTEQVVGLFTGAAVDEFTGVLAVETIVWVLQEKSGKLKSEVLRGQEIDF